MENENEAQPQYQAQIQETLVIKHLNFEGLNTAQTIPSNNTNKLENVPVSHTGEKLEIEDGRKIKHEKANEMGEETDAQLPKITKESKFKKFSNSVKSLFYTIRNYRHSKN